MKKMIYKCILICVLGCLFQLPNAYSQVCDFDFRYQTTQIEDDNFVFSLTPNNASGNFTFKLYDLIEGKVIAEKQVTIGSKSQEIEFRDIKPSTYTVFIFKEGCKSNKTVGGIEGIILTSER